MGTPDASVGEPGVGDSGSNPTTPARDAAPVETPPPTPDAGGAPDDAGSVPTNACWVFSLHDDSHSTSDNCVGIQGTNSVESDPSSDSSIAVTYANGDVCFEGSIDSDGWGSIYNFTLADSGSWNADAREVGGFEFAMSGPVLPERMRVIFNDTTTSDDFCRALTPASLLTVPFESTHRDCSTAPGADTPSTTLLTDLRLAFLPPTSGAYAVDFCMEIRAIP
jgi:hypothetical protein